MIGRASLSLAAIVLLGACGFSFSPASLSVPLDKNDFGAFQLLVYDETGLVASGRANDPRGDLPAKITVAPETQELHLSWLGGACSHRPTLHLTGDASQLHVDLQASAPDSPLPIVVSCPAVGILFGLTLGLTAPVQQGAITLSASP